MWTKLRQFVYSRPLTSVMGLSMGMWSKPDESQWIWGKRRFCSFQCNINLGLNWSHFCYCGESPPEDEPTHHRNRARSHLKMWNSGSNHSWTPLYLWTFQLYDSMNSFHCLSHFELNFSFATKSIPTDSEILFYKVEEYPSRYMTQTVSKRESNTKLKDRVCVNLCEVSNSPKKKQRTSGGLFGDIGKLLPYNMDKKREFRLLGAFFKTFQ